MESPVAGAAVAMERPAVPADRPWRLARDLVLLTRPHQWVKNLVAVGIAMADLNQNVGLAVQQAAIAVLTFTIAAGLVYIVNDIVDRDRDRAHPLKRYRPIASGRVTVPTAAAFAVVLASVLAMILAAEPVGWSWVVLGYLAMSAAYTVKLKHVPILDVFVVATGFVLRVMLGYLAIGSPLSGWLVIAVFLGSLLLAVGKRRQELTLVGAGQRPALAGYTVQLADQLMLVSSVLTVCSVLQYVRTEAMLGEYAARATAVTTLLGVFGLFRYLQAVLVYRRGEDPVRTLVRDWSIVAAGVLGVAQLAVFLILARTGG